MFPGRQPIRDRDQCSVAYELLFRAGNTSGVTVTADMLLPDLLELLPRTQVVLELLETISITDAVIKRCRELNLEERLAAALLQREGELGTLLRLVESVEHPDLEDTPLLLAQSGALSLSDLTTAEIGAMSWANQIAEATA